MSAHIPHCDKCDLDRVFVRLTGVPNASSYGVEWRCAKCDGHILDLCPLGPLVPSSQTCLNCGAEHVKAGDFAECPFCGMTRLGALDFFGLDPAPVDPIVRAEKFFSMGLPRRALATLNHALIGHPDLEAAWRLKYAFVSGLGFTQAALTIVEAASAHVVNPDLLISYAHLLRELGRQREAMDVYREYLVTSPDGEYAAMARDAMRQSRGDQ